MISDMPIMKKNSWTTVSHKQPCLICKKPDWCGFTDNAACCMRIQSHKQLHNGGWLHLISDPIPRMTIPTIRSLETPKPLECLPLWNKWTQITNQEALGTLADSLGVAALSLHLLSVVRAPEHMAWAFPMKDAMNQMVGLRLRNERGEKWAVKGSKQGLFIPCIDFTKTLTICEGPTDTAAALTLGLSPIGRPSCIGCEDQILKFIAINRIKEVIIICDNDTPGIKGANKLQNMLRIPSCLVLLPCKDLRQFLQNGGDKETIDSIIKNLTWINPRR